MNAYMNAIETTPNKAYTQNGGKTYDSSTNPNLDLFFLIGSARNADVIPVFEAAYGNDPEKALRTVLWARDIRGGAGERETVRKVLKHMEVYHLEDLLVILPSIPEYGRWDDLLIFESEVVKTAVAGMVKKALESGNSLCAKWMPRKGKVAYDLRGRLSMTPKQYRKTLVGLTKVVETQMCDKDWENINFAHVPSVAASRYRKAFYRNAESAYSAYVDGLKKGTEKINASAIFPHDVIKDMIGRWSSISDSVDIDVVTAQWNALPNYVGDANIIPMVDTSGSMYSPIGGNTTAMHVSLSLGMYVSEKNTGPFNGAYLTFSESPKLCVLKGNLVTRLKSLERSDWGMNTNIEAAFDKVLSMALKNKVSQDDMPDYLMVFSDMEFDRCVSGKRTFKDAKKKFKKAGYKLPVVVFWNLNGRPGNVPVKARDEDTVLVSGFSPAILKTVLSAEEITPESIMNQAIMADRYDVFGEVDSQ